MSDTSEQGRRILLAIVTGEPGDRIQRWRETHDPEQARRYPPHATLHYRLPHSLDVDALGKQIRYAFAAPVTVRLSGPAIFENAQRTLYVQVLDTEELDGAQDRLHDGTHVALPLPAHHTWHVTALRQSGGAAPEVLSAAETDLCIETPWRIDRIELLELRGARYEVVERWSL